MSLSIFYCFINFFTEEKVIESIILDIVFNAKEWKKNEIF